MKPRRQTLKARLLVSLAILAATSAHAADKLAPEIDPLRADRASVMLATLDRFFPPDQNLTRTEDCERFWSFRTGSEREWRTGMASFTLLKLCSDGSVESQRAGIFSMSPAAPFHVHWLGFNESSHAEQASNAFQRWRDELQRDPTIDEVTVRWPDQQFGPTRRLAARKRFLDIQTGVEMAAGNRLRLGALESDKRDRRTYGWIGEFFPAIGNGIACVATIEAFFGEISDVRCDPYQKQKPRKKP